MSGNKLPTLDRRTFVKHAGAGVLAFNTGAALLTMTPAEARKRDLPFRTLSPDEVLTLEALGDVLVPGAKKGRARALHRSAAQRSERRQHADDQIPRLAALR